MNIDVLEISLVGFLIGFYGLSYLRWKKRNNQFTSGTGTHTVPPKVGSVIVFTPPNVLMVTTPLPTVNVDPEKDHMDKLEAHRNKMINTPICSNCVDKNDSIILNSVDLPSTSNFIADDSSNSTPNTTNSSSNVNNGNS